MHEFVDDEVGQRTLLSHTALCFVVAGALGLFGGGIAGLMHFAPLSAITRYAMVAVCIMTSFAIFWCSPNGPSRWRPFIITSQLAENIFGGAAGVIVCTGIAVMIGKAL